MEGWRLREATVECGRLQRLGMAGCCTIETLQVGMADTMQPGVVLPGCNYGRCTGRGGGLHGSAGLLLTGACVLRVYVYVNDSGARPLVVEGGGRTRMQGHAGPQHRRRQGGQDMAQCQPCAPGY